MSHAFFLGSLSLLDDAGWSWLAEKSWGTRGGVLRVFKSTALVALTLSAFLEVWLYKPTHCSYLLSPEAKESWQKEQKATGEMYSYGICLIHPQWRRKNTLEKHQERKIKMKELKIMSPRMLPNLSNSSTAAVKSRNLFFKGKKTSD